MQFAYILFSLKVTRNATALVDIFIFSQFIFVFQYSQERILQHLHFAAGF